MKTSAQREHKPFIHRASQAQRIGKFGSVGERSAVRRIIGNLGVQRKLTIGQPNDKYEQEADQVADKVMRMSDADVAQRVESGTVQAIQVQRKCPACEEELQRQPEEDEAEGMVQAKEVAGQVPQVDAEMEARINSLKSGGTPLDPATRGFFEPRFGRDFGDVRVHEDGYARGLAASINARAFTIGRDVVFGAGEYAPGSLAGKKLLAHELTHVVQQRGGKNSSVQRTIELRPPGPGEASAFNRRQELVDRLNNLSRAVFYSLAADDRTLNYRVLFQPEISGFDQQMMDFIDLDQVIPMRLITSRGTVNRVPIVFDSYLYGYVDLDDLAASDDLGFQSLLVHFLRERAVTRNYERRIGTPGIDRNTETGRANFNRAHRAGHEAQAEHFRDVFNDPSIVFNRGRRRNNRGDADIIFRSRAHHYRVLVTIRRGLFSGTGQRPNLVTGGNVTVLFNGRSFSVDDFLSTGPLAATLHPYNGRVNFGLPWLGQLGFPGLQLDPALRLGLPAVGPLLPPRPPGFGLGPLLTQPASSPNAATGSRPLLLSETAPPLFPDPSRIDWLPIRDELNTRGVPFDITMQRSIISLWMNNFSFLHRTIGLPTEQAVFWTNKTIPMAVGAAVNRDYPTMIEQMDRELNTSSRIIPVSDIFLFLIGR